MLASRVNRIVLLLLRSHNHGEPNGIEQQERSCGESSQENEQIHQDTTERIVGWGFSRCCEPCSLKSSRIASEHHQTAAAHSRISPELTEAATTTSLNPYALHQRHSW